MSDPRSVPGTNYYEPLDQRPMVKVNGPCGPTGPQSLVSDSVYDEDYYLRGKESGKSLYANYRWMPELTIPMAQAMIRHLGIKPYETTLDYGCARGYLVRALRELGFPAWGHDISKWAMENADEEVKQYLLANRPEVPPGGQFDWVIAKDVLEHVHGVESTILDLMCVARVGVFAVVPLAERGPEYDVLEYEKDITHIHRKPLSWWIAQFHYPGWSVTGSYRVRGIKDNYAQYPTGNGFIVARRLPEDW